MTTAHKCKTKYLAKSAIIYTVVAAALLLTAKAIFAQQTSRSITIVPPSVAQNVGPGVKQEGILKVVNNSAETLTFNAQVKDFIVKDDIGTPYILSDNTLSTKYSASNWIAVSPSSFTLAPGKTQEINYYLQVPLDARPGGHYAAVMYQPQQLIGVQGTGTGVQTYLGTLFYVNVSGNMVINASVKSFSADKAFQQYGPVNLTAEIANYSDTSIAPQGKITVKNLIGQTVYTQILPDHNIFPEAVRKFQNKIDKKFMFGKYTAELNATYGPNNDHTLYATTDFVVLPWKVTAIVILIIIVIILLVIFMRRKRGRNRKIMSETENSETKTEVEAPQYPQS